MLPLSRTCRLSDFVACQTVAEWQQQLAALAWQAWREAHHLRVRDPSLVVNTTGVGFVAPGPTARYHATPPMNGDRSPVSAIFALSVLDHIEAPVAFLSQAIEILPASGLLFLTFAYWDAEGDDTAAGREERRRIYSAHSYQRLIRDARRVGFETFGGIDWRYHGDCLEDHSLASLVLQRRPRGRR